MALPQGTRPPLSLDEKKGQRHKKTYPNVNAPETVNNFPFPKFRQYQREKIVEIVEAFNSGYRWILLETPTGFGKSPVNVALGRTLRSFYITPQNLLLDQLVSDFPDLALIKGRRHYVCAEQPSFNCDDGPCKRDKNYQCGDKYLNCPYWEAKIKAIEAHISLTNFAYFIGEGKIRNPNIPHLGDRELCVVDEGHNIDQHILNQISLTIGTRTLPYSVFQGLRSVLTGLPKKLNGEQIDDLLNFTASLCSGYLDHLPNRLTSQQIVESKKANNFIQKVEKYWEHHNADWVGQTNKKTYSRGTWLEAKIQPTFVRDFMGDHLWNRADKFIISSATIFVNDFISQCGLTDHRDEVYHIVAPSTFPIENRMIVDASVGSLSWKNRQQNMPAALDTIKKILDREPGKGVIHAHSYAFAEAIRGIKDDRLLFHESRNRDETLQKFLGSPAEDGAVLVAVAMTEGLDLRGDLATFQVLLKCPYANFKDDLRVNRRLIQLRHNRWYAIQTLKVIVQAYGRAVRSKTDQANFYVLDSDVNKICKQWRRQLPRFFAEAYNKREIFE